MDVSTNRGDCPAALRTLPDGAAQHVPARAPGVFLAPLLALAAGYGLAQLVWRITGGEDSMQPSDAGIAGAVALVSFPMAWWLLLRVNTALFDSRGRLREQQIGDQRKAWARQYGWAYTAGPESIADCAQPIAMPRRAEPVHAARILRGRFRGRGVSIETWVLAGPRHWRQYFRGDGRVAFTPLLVSVIHLHTDTPLPTVGLLPPRGVDLPYGRPSVLQGQRTRLELPLKVRIASPDLTTPEVVDAIGADVRRFRRRPLRLVASGHTVALTVKDEVGMEALGEYLEIVSDIAHVLERGP